MVQCPDCRLRPVLHADLLQDGLDVHFDRPIGNLELVRDLLVLSAVEQAGEDLHLAVRQAVDMAHVSVIASRHYPSVGQEVGKVRGEHLLAKQDKAQRLLQGVARHVLEQVAVDTCRQRVCQTVYSDGFGQDDDPGARSRDADLIYGCYQRLAAIGKVDENQSRLQGFDEGERIVDRERLVDDLERGIREDSAQSLAKKSTSIDQK